MIFTNAEIDAASEVFSIGMGSAANTISQVLDKPVTISKIKAAQCKISELDISGFKSGLYAATKCNGALDGNGGMIFKAVNIQAILNILMMTDIEVDDNFEFDEMGLSTIQEIFNMMMQTCASSMNEFLQDTTVLFLNAKSLKNDSLTNELDASVDTEILYIVFKLDVTGVTSEEFIYVFSPKLMESLRKTLIKAGMITETPEVAEIPPASDFQQAAPEGYNQGYNPYDPAYAAAYYQQPQYAYEPPPFEEETPEYKIMKPHFPDFAEEEDMFVPAAYVKENMENILKVDLRVSAELGRVIRKMKDIVEFKEGTILNLDKGAGAPIDIIVNKQSVGRGDVIVIGDNFYVRITEIFNDLRQKKRK